ncbi:MAG: hypothetical protein NZ730_02715 [Porticoccaceae bacterium]|nr:hypothetical protein [Porticoccaceae bacterium]
MFKKHCYKSLIATFSNCLFLLTLLVSCGGTTQPPPPPPPPPIDRSLEITSFNYDVAVAYGYGIPESMLQIAQLIENYVSIFNQQASSTFSENCDNGGQVEINHEDVDFDGILSASDKLNLSFSDCYHNIIDDSVGGTITLELTSFTNNSGQYNADIHIEIYDDESTVLLTNQQLLVSFSTTEMVEKLSIASDNSATTFQFDGLTEIVQTLWVEKLINLDTKQYSTAFNFFVDSSALDAEFSCHSVSPFIGYIYSLPLQYNFECSGKNTISIINQSDDIPQTYDTDVRINNLDGTTETISINHDNYIEGSLYKPFSSGYVEFISDVIEATLPELGHASFIRVDKQTNTAYLGGMVFNQSYQGVLYKLDLADLSVIESITLTDRIHRMRLSADASKLYIIEEGSKSVTIYDTADLTISGLIDIEALGLTEPFSINHIDIVPIAETPDQWIYYYKSSGFSHTILFDGVNFVDSIAVENNAGTIFGSLYNSAANTFHLMEVTSNAEREVHINKYQIIDNQIILSLQSNFQHTTNISGLSDSQYYQIRFVYDGHLYLDGGFVVALQGLTLFAETGINKPALSEVLGRIYDLNGSPEIEAFSLDTLAPLSGLNGYEKPWSQGGYIIEDGNTGFIIMSSRDKVYRVGKSLLP